MYLLDASSSPLRSKSSSIIFPSPDSLDEEGKTVSKKIPDSIKKIIMKDPGQSGAIQRLLIVDIDIGGGAITR